MATGDSGEQQQSRRLRRSRIVATGMLVAAAGVFAATLALSGPGWPWLLLRAVSEAALVGGLADWFAVTALFRRPLGLPIPHTAILPANRDRIGEGLARFLDRHFLASDVLAAELRSLRLADRAAAWLANRRNAGAVAASVTRALPHLLRAIEDRQIVAFVRRALGPQLRHAAFGPLVAQAIKVLTASGYHEAVLDRALDYGRDFLVQNEARLLAAVGERRRRWIPRAVNREIARAMLRAARELIDDLRQPYGSLRHSLLAAIDAMAADLAAAPPEANRLPALLNDPQLQAWLANSWRRLRDLLLADLAEPSSRLRRTLAIMIASVGEALRGDADMRARLDAAIEAAVVEALPWRQELVRFVTAVVQQWEPKSFAARIEAAVGADLQYIRMNGTVVGGLVGGVLYLISLLAR
ncbi:MAG TPA: DUF445 domain-containing protein [Stellaceae bacterium]|nr:DUF445 domain-containing protein [Stellaceae bacterium]